MPCSCLNEQQNRQILFFLLCHFRSPAQPVRDFTLYDLVTNDLMDQPWSQVASLFPPVHAFTFVGHTVQNSHFSLCSILCLPICIISRLDLTPFRRPLQNLRVHADTFTWGTECLELVGRGNFCWVEKLEVQL